MRTSDSRFQIPDSIWLRRAQAALSTIFLIGGIVLLFATSLALIAISFLNSSLGFQSANRAAAIAMSGIRDAELLLERDKDFSDASGYCVPYHAITNPCPAGYATVTVTQGSPSSGQATVLSIATWANRRRRLQAVYVVSATTSQITPLSITTL